MLTSILSVLLLFHVLLLLSGAVLLHFEKERKASSYSFSVFPFISILVAARNEEENIGKCLASLAALDYPSDKFEVLIGNDGSEDRTAEIVAGFCHRYSHFRLFNIEGRMGTAIAKANVLAQLARNAKGEFFFITDADMQMPRQWLKAMLPHFSESAGIMSGSTTVQAGSLASRLQGMEWTFLMGQFHLISNFYPVAALGNNMVVLSKAYFETGGYENMPPTVTEDYALMKAIYKLGYKHIQVLDHKTIGLTSPLASFRAMLDQRRRWLVGGKKQPWYIYLLSVIYGIFVPGLILLFVLNGLAAILILALKIIADSVFYAVSAKRTGQKISYVLLSIFSFYLNFLTVSYFIYSLFPGRVKWKGRKLGN